MTTDPRAPNCQAFTQDADGKVTGVVLDWHEQPATMYALRSVVLIDEAAAQGKHVATVWVEDVRGHQTVAKVGLAYPYTGSPTGIPFVAWPGGTNTSPVQHVISNGYTPPAVGPLAIAVYSQQGQIISDVCGSLGLPLGHHVCYDLIFRERGVEQPPTVVDKGEVRAVLLHIRGELDALIATLPTPPADGGAVG